MAKKKSRAEIGKYSKGKGKRGERAIVNFFKDNGLESRRYLQYEKSWDDPDVDVISPDGKVYQIEVKWREKECSNYWFKPEPFKKRKVPSLLLKWLDKHDAVAFTKNNFPWMVFLMIDEEHTIISLEEFLERIQKNV